MIKKYKLQMRNSDSYSYNGSENTSIERASLLQDIESKTMYGIFASNEGEQERYYNNEYMYYKDEMSEGKWVKAQMEEPFMGEFDGFSSLYSKSSIFYAGLNYSLDTKLKEIKLIGMGYSDIIEKYIFMTASTRINNVELSDYKYEILIDQATYKIKAVKFYIKGKSKPNSVPFRFEKNLDMEFIQINQIEAIPVPEGIDRAEIIEG